MQTLPPQQETRSLKMRRFLSKSANRLGDRPTLSYPIAQDFRLPGKHEKGRMAALCDSFCGATDGRADKQAGNFADRNRIREDT